MSGGAQRAAGPVDLSPGETTVAFDPIVPPVRIPVPAGGDDDPSKGEWVLAFADDESWRRGWQKCHGKVSQQCEIGARMGCSISAANVCRVPWWKQALIFMKIAKIGDEERAECEEREMMTCLAGSKESCTRFARDTCDPVFADARIAESHVRLDSRFTNPPRRNRWTRLVKKQNEYMSDEKLSDAALADRCQVGGGSEDVRALETDPKKLTNYRGRKLMATESIQRCWDGPAWSERAPEGEISGRMEAPIDGWEGGLIRPKFDSRIQQNEDQNLSNARKDPFWQGVGH